MSAPYTAPPTISLPPSPPAFLPIFSVFSFVLLAPLRAPDHNTDKTFTLTRRPLFMTDHGNSPGYAFHLETIIYLSPLPSANC